MTVFTELAMQSLLRIWFKFFAWFDKGMSVNCMDEKKRGVTSEQSVLEARRQAASAARVLSLSSVSDVSSLIMVVRISVGR